MTIFIIKKHGISLMPTFNIKKIRNLLKSNKARIIGYNPFTVQLLYETTNNVQPIEISVDTGYENIGISVKSKKHEYIHEERKTLTDEVLRHETQVRYRRARRSRKRYRKPHWNNNKPKGWIAPSLQHKIDLHIQCVKRYKKICPITTIIIEVGIFDTVVLKALEKGESIQGKINYQYGPKYSFDTLKSAVFYRDNYTCQCCGKSSIKNNIALRIHHIGFRDNDHSNRIDNLLTVCNKCHTSANHSKGGKLWNLKPKIKPLKSEAFMNIARWSIYNQIKNIYGQNTNIYITYGAITKRNRIDLNIQKGHANDAYCIGNFQPKHKANLKLYQKKRRNNRCIEKFYDAVYIDRRDGLRKKGSEIGCNRTDRSIPRNNVNNCRKYHGTKIKKGQRRIRKNRYLLRPGDVILFKNKKYIVKGCISNGEYVTLKGTKKTLSTKKVKIVYHTNGWSQIN